MLKCFWLFVICIFRSRVWFCFKKRKQSELTLKQRSISQNRFDVTDNIVCSIVWFDPEIHQFLLILLLFFPIIFTIGRISCRTEMTFSLFSDRTARLLPLVDFIKALKTFDANPLHISSKHSSSITSFCYFLCVLLISDDWEDWMW